MTIVCLSWLIAEKRYSNSSEDLESNAPVGASARIQKENIHIILSGVNDQVHAVLEKSGFYELLGKENICSNINEALEVAAKEVKEL